MKWKNRFPFVLIIATLILNACAFKSPSTITATREATNTPAATSTKAPLPTMTPSPTKTPNLAATQRFEEWSAEIQGYADAGYIGTTEGKLQKLDDFSEEWAQIDWYTTWLLDERASNFVYSAHFKWVNASKTPNPSGCGLVFAIQEDGGDYSVFLNQDSILYLQTKFNRGYYVGKTRGTGKTNIGDATEADFTIIVNNYYSYVLINGEVVGEYSLSKSEPIDGEIGISILSGTNKDFGTRCEVTNMHLWTPYK